MVWVWVVVSYTLTPLSCLKTQPHANYPMKKQSKPKQITKPKQTKPKPSELRYQDLAREYIKQHFNGVRAYAKVYPDANYDTAKNNMCRMLTNASFLNALTQERERITASDMISVDKIILNILEDRHLARLKDDISTMRACDDLLGKTLAMFISREQIENITEKATTGQLRQSIGSAMDYIKKAQEN